MKYTGEQAVILLAVLPNFAVAVLTVLIRRRLAADIRPLVILIWFALGTEACCRTLWLLQRNNLFLLPAYVVVEFGLLAWLYRPVLAGRWPSALWWPLGTGLTGIAVLELLLHSSWPAAYNHGARLLESILVVALALTYYSVAVRKLRTAAIWQEPMFWISTGLLGFFSGVFLIYTVTSFAYHYHRSVIVQVWVINAVLNALLYCTYAYALWLSQKT